MVQGWDRQGLELPCSLQPLAPAQRGTQTPHQPLPGHASVSTTGKALPMTLGLALTRKQACTSLP